MVHNALTTLSEHVHQYIAMCVNDAMPAWFLMSQSRFILYRAAIRARL